MLRWWDSLGTSSAMCEGSCVARVQLIQALTKGNSNGLAGIGQVAEASDKSSQPSPCRVRLC